MEKAARFWPTVHGFGKRRVVFAGGLLPAWTAIDVAQDVAMAQRTSMADSRDVYCPQQYLHNPEATDDMPLPPTPPGP